MSGKRGPSASSFGPTSGDVPWRFRWSEIGDEAGRARADGSIAPQAFVRTRLRHPEAAEDADAEDDDGGRMALVEVRATLHDDDRARRRSGPRTSVPACPAAVEGGQPGISAYADLDRVGDGVREASEAAAEHDPDRGSKLGTARDRSDRGVQGLAQADPSSARASILSTCVDRPAPDRR